MSQLDNLRRRLEVLEDERAVLARLYTYGHAVDSGDDGAFVNFTADGVCDVTDPDGGPVARTVRGREMSSSTSDTPQARQRPRKDGCPGRDPAL